MERGRETLMETHAVPSLSMRWDRNLILTDCMGGRVSPRARESQCQCPTLSPSNSERRNTPTDRELVPEPGNEFNHLLHAMFAAIDAVFIRFVVQPRQDFSLQMFDRGTWDGKERSDGRLGEVDRISELRRQQVGPVRCLCC